MRQFTQPIPDDPGFTCVSQAVAPDGNSVITRDNVATKRQPSIRETDIAQGDAATKPQPALAPVLRLT